MRKSLPIGIFAIVSFFLPNVFGTTILYQTGFEQPTFNPGNLNGQDGFTASGSTVQSSVVASGSQAMTAVGAQSIRGGARSFTSYNPVGNAEPFLIGETSFRYTGTPSGSTPVLLLGDPVFSYFIRLDANRFLALARPGTVPIPSSTELNADQWYRLQLVLDFATNQATGYVNGAQFSQISFPTEGRSFNRVDLLSFGATGYWDDVLVYSSATNPYAVPEPSTFGLFACGAAAMVLARRRVGRG